MEKPPSCIGCSLYGDGKGFVGGFYPHGAVVKLVGSNPEESDERLGVALSGKTGNLLETHYLPILGLELEGVARDNVLRCRWKPPGKRLKTDEFPTGKDLTLAIDQCRQYDVDPPEIKLTLLLGDIVFKYFYPDLKVGEWVGHLLATRSHE